MSFAEKYSLLLLNNGFLQFFGIRFLQILELELISLCGRAFSKLACEGLLQQRDSWSIELPILKFLLKGFFYQETEAFLFLFSFIRLTDIRRILCQNKQEKEVLSFVFDTEFGLSTRKFKSWMAITGFDWNYRCFAFLKLSPQNSRTKFI